MWLKILVILVLIAMLYSLAVGFYGLMKDRSGSPRLIWSLTARIACAGIILGLVAYGLSTGDLHISAPWLRQ